MGQTKVKQTIRRMSQVIGNDKPCREDLTVYFYGSFSPLFCVFQRRLGWDHGHFIKFVLTSMRRSANQGTATQLYDTVHPQLDLYE